MSAAFRSAIRSSEPRNDNLTGSRRKAPARATNTSPNNLDDRQGSAPQNVSRLAKMPTRSITTSEKAEHGTKIVVTVPAYRAPTGDPALAGKRLSVAMTEGLHTTNPNSIPQRHSGVSALPFVRTPSLVSGSPVSTFNSPRSSTLRRGPSLTEKSTAQKRVNIPVEGLGLKDMGSCVSTVRKQPDECYSGIPLPPTSRSNSQWPSSSSPRTQAIQYVNPAGNAGLSTRESTPSIPTYAQCATPSSYHTDSPFSHIPTPSSASSYGSGTVATTRAESDRRQPSSPRSRPPVTARGNVAGDTSRPGLPPVRESSTSSSNATVKLIETGAVPAARRIPRKPVPSANANPSQMSTSSSHVKAAKGVCDISAAAEALNKPRALQVPPELAHLNVELPSKPSAKKPLPPLRPSRDGMPSLSDMKRPTLVIRSDLPAVYTTYHKRTPSQETPVSATSPNFKSRFGFGSRSSSRQGSPRIDSAISMPASARGFARCPTPDALPSKSQPLQRQDTPAVELTRSPSKNSRFALFSRQPKQDPSRTAEKPKREPRKGPAAGTGHEGYGRFGFRGRSGSTTSSVGHRSPSADSSASSLPPASTSMEVSFSSSKEVSDLDDFLRNRMSPIAPFDSARLAKPTGQSVYAARGDLVESSTSSSLESYPTPQLLPSAMHGGLRLASIRHPTLDRQTHSDTSEGDAEASFPTATSKGFFTRASQAESRSAARLPTPISTRDPRKRSVGSGETEATVWPKTDSTPIEDSMIYDTTEGSWLRSGTADSTRPRKWNFLQRAQASPRPKGKAKAVDPLADRPVTSSVYRGAPHYAMLDPIEPVGLEDMEKILQDTETSTEASFSSPQPPSKIVPYEPRHAALMPSPRNEIGQDADFKARPLLPRIIVGQEPTESPELLKAQAATVQAMPLVVDIPRSPVAPPQRTPDISKHLETTPEMPSNVFQGSENSSNNNSPRQPRLSPIGRIPQVVSKRDRDRKLPDNSFSRPFARTQPHPSVKPPGALYHQIRELASPIEAVSQPVSSTTAKSDAVSAGPVSSIATDLPSASTDRTSIDGGADTFLAFSPRKNSDISYSSSNASWLASQAAQQPQQDDPWNEYNDLLDDMLPQKATPPAGLSLGAHLPSYSGQLFDHSPSVPPPLQLGSPPPTSELPVLPRAATSSVVSKVPHNVAYAAQSTPPLPEIVDVHTHRSASGRERSSHRTSLPPPTRGSGSHHNRISMPSTRGSVSSRYSRASRHSRSASLPEHNVRNSTSSLTPSARFNRDTQLLGIAEVQGEDQASLANLRFGALMTSKWLSFGRVLFSPAHNEIRLADDARVLVIDGLGSDWSYYVALSYTTATVYNLGPAAINGLTSWPSIHQKPPLNHRHIPHAGIWAGFPFPKGFFTAVVFRFPIATSEANYQHCIYECKRVLRPGGYLEVAALDLDLMNMGGNARKVIRGLKTRMQLLDKNVSLRSNSDLMLRLIGRRGFENVQRCIVGVPVAGRIPRSQDISSITSSRSSSDRAPPASHEPRGSAAEKEFSFSDLLHDARSLSNNNSDDTSKKNDECITKMVARVGRWWYSTCYETVLRRERLDASIFHDRALLRECERQGTSFRLCLLTAQKPALARRRTVSV